MNYIQYLPRVVIDEIGVQGKSARFRIVSPDGVEIDITKLVKYFDISASIDEMTEISLTLVNITTKNGNR